MDYTGQRLAEWLLVRILIVVGAVSFVAGYATGSYPLMVKINLVGLAFTCLLVLPSWPVFRRNPLTWLPALNPPKKK